MIRFCAAALIAMLAGGCGFQPLYGERTLTGEPGLAAVMQGVDITQITAAPGTPLARLAVEVRNELTFGMNDGRQPKTHRLDIVLSTGATSLIVDPTTARPEFEMISVDATFTLVDIATAKPVMNAFATARVSYDIPGQQQRLGLTRGQRSAQSRAALVIAQQIRARLASYFASAKS
jgi:LPS-assembly lipoprotein